MFFTILKYWNLYCDYAWMPGVTNADDNYYTFNILIRNSILSSSKISNWTKLRNHTFACISIWIIKNPSYDSHKQLCFHERWISVSKMEEVWGIR